MTRLLLLSLLPIFGGCSAKKAEYRALSNPTDADAWENLGDAYRLQFKRDQAADAYREALRLDPGREYLATRISGRPSEVAKELRKQALAEPGNDELWGDLGDVLMADGDTMGARGAYLRAFHLDSDDSEWHRKLVDLGAGDVVLADARQSLRENDDESLGDFGDLLMATGNQEEACVYWERAANLDPSDTEWLNHAEQCGFALPEGAIDPTGALADTGLGYLHGDPTGGLAGPDDIPGLLRRRNSDAGLLVRIGQAYILAGDSAAAEEALWSALLVAPTDEEAMQSYLMATRQTRRQTLEALRAVYPDEDEVAGALGDHYLDLGLRAEALRMYDTAHDLDDDDPEWEDKTKLMRGPR